MARTQKPASETETPVVAAPPAPVEFTTDESGNASGLKPSARYAIVEIPADATAVKVATSGSAKMGNHTRTVSAVTISTPLAD